MKYDPKPYVTAHNNLLYEVHNKALDKQNLKVIRVFKIVAAEAKDRYRKYLTDKTELKFFDAICSRSKKEAKLKLVSLLRCEVTIKQLIENQSESSTN